MTDNPETKTANMGEKVKTSDQTHDPKKVATARDTDSKKAITKSAPPPQKEAHSKAPAAKTKLSPGMTGQPVGEQRIPKGVGEVKRRRIRLIISFVLFVILPSCLGATYYTMYASDRYASGASFVVRGFNDGGGGDLVSSFTGLTSSGSTTADSYIIRRYLQSGDLLLFIDEIDGLDLQKHYTDDSVDFVSRFRTGSPFEEFVDYWARRIITTYDSTTGIITFEVQAFDPDKALALANAILVAADALVNELSFGARRDSLSFALAEVERAESNLREAQIALRQFRSAAGTADPMVNAQLDAQLIAELEAQVADISARITALEENVDQGSPILQQLERRKDAIQAQINERRAAVGTDTAGSATADSLGLFESLQIEQAFAQQRYASALTSLEQARIDADRLQRYLAVFSKPLLPEEAVYPKRLRNILLIIAASLVLWVISTLIVYAVRDHLR